MTAPAMANPCETVDAEQVEPAAGALTQARAGVSDSLSFAARRCGIGSIGTDASSNSTSHSLVDRRRFRPGSGEVGVYREHRTADQLCSRISAIGSGPGRYLRLTAAGIAIGAGCSHRHFTVRASRTTRRSSWTRHCVKARIGLRTKNSGFSNR